MSATAWIKIRIALPEDPAVIEMADALDIDEDEVVGKLVRVWGWADEHVGEDGIASMMTRRRLDKLAGKPGFAEAMIAVGWLVELDIGMTFPRYAEHNGPTGKSRAQAAKRQQAVRNRRMNAASANPDTPKPEKRAIRWGTVEGFTGITDADRERWAKAYPACDLDRQLAAMDDWLRGNPAKARKSNWASFIGRWLSKAQDQGGDVPSNRPGGRGKSIGRAGRDAMTDPREVQL